ncbi:flagellar hook-associated protein FlgK [Marinomonas transparens]|uniref:Flagellar hook-associated protein 1 n=1 Tax=Marinomonas transparens TaxID=2795388 RepID=A0A934JSB3_9GAMM|nr:flagellar hook-associated protein FlgK [Marinomonas transparens]MBJ7539803.1 flagellar hook-associated protein FlgK [Marinomonas transparens]
MGSSLFSVGLSGLQSSNARINTTGHNTANVDTEGYSRQRVSATSSPVGGVVMRDTSRLVDKFINEQVRVDTSNFSYYDTYHSMISVSDGLLAEDSIALNGYLNKAFEALQMANNDPSSPSLRELAHSSLDSLVNQYNTLSGIVGEQESIVDDQLAASLIDLNALTTQIADLNTQILQQESMSISPANELRDQQELLAKDIAKYLHIKTQFTSNGTMTIQLANGQPLVMEQNATEVKLELDPLEPKKINLMIDFDDYDVALTSDNLGGSIGGLIDFRSEYTMRADRTLGQHAISIADAMNSQNALGIDANGGFGRKLFTLGDVQINVLADNKGKAPDLSVRVSKGESAKITTDSYELIKTGDDHFLVRTYDLSGELTGKSVLLDLNSKKDGHGFYKLDELGLDIRLGDVDDYKAGDAFRFSPAQGAAASLRLSAQNGSDIALSAPIGVSTNSDNLSEAKIELSSVTNTDPDTSAFSRDATLYPSAPHSIYFTAPNAYEVRDASGGVLASVDGVQNFSDLLEKAGLAKDAGFDVSISSRPKMGDVFSMSVDELGESDNFNGLALADLQNQDLVGGKSTLATSYAGFVAYVGSKTAELEGNAKSTEVIMNQSIGRRDKLSAVSLDEEAVNLLKYQQSYSAAAQVITAARTTFDTLLGAMR